MDYTIAVSYTHLDVYKRQHTHTHTHTHSKYVRTRAPVLPFEPAIAL